MGGGLQAGERIQAVEASSGVQEPAPSAIFRGVHVGPVGYSARYRRGTATWIPGVFTITFSGVALPHNPLHG